MRISSLKPTEVWTYFEDILSIPRPSKKEDQIIDYLLRFGAQHNLKTLRDEAGNVIISKPATKGYEKVPSVVLQSHVDMVCEKNSNVQHDFNSDPIHAYIDNGWVKAKGTTLGADDGIGIAAQLAILASSEVEHGPLECLFTVDEETGLTGAFELQPGFFHSKILINLDSEDEGELFIGCAGGMDTVATLSYETERVPTNSIGFKLSVTGLKGGHSGDDIDKGLGNSIKIINRLLWKGANKFDLRLATIDAGNLRNAIPREAFAHFVVHQEDAESMQQLFGKLRHEILFEFSVTEPYLNIALEEASLPEWVINETTQYDLLNGLYACPHGVIEMSHRMPGLVQTSTNLASVKFIQDHQILVTTSQRSAIDSSKADTAFMVESVFRLANASVVHSEGYPGWTPNPNSEILQVARRSYQKLFGTEPVVRAIHAGLECGLFLEKYPQLDMISFGPTIKGAHSPDERLDIESTDRFWRLLLDVLKSVK